MAGWSHDFAISSGWAIVVPVANHGIWRSLVARLVRDEEVVGSNPAIPTDRNPLIDSVSRAGFSLLSTYSAS